MKCLVVDQSATIRRILINTVRDRQPAEFIEAADTAAALASLGEGVQLVLTDWNLPDRSGLELLRELRHRTETAGIPVVMVTSRNRREDVTEAMTAGVNSYVVRPFSPDTLRSHILPFLPVDSDVAMPPSASAAPTAEETVAEPVAEAVDVPAEPAPIA